MPYPDIKESRFSTELAFAEALAFIPEIILVVVFGVWAIFHFGFEIDQLWLSILLTAMVFLAFTCIAFFFFADAIEHVASRRKMKFRRKL